MKLISYLLLIITFMVAIVFALFSWLNAIADSYFYWAIGKFFQTGIYPFVAPFIYDRPTTISPPAYGLLLIFLQNFIRADIILHLLQLILLALTSYFIYKILLSSTGKYLALVAACLHFLIPGNLIYTSYALTETGAQTLIAFYLYLLWRYLTHHPTIWIELAIFVGFIMTLWKYSLIIYGIIALLIFIRRPTRNPRSYILPFLGIITITLWVYLNFQITGVIGLSDAKGIQLWNQAVWVGKILPGESSPSMRELRKFVPGNVDLYRGYWDLQPYILPQVNQSWKIVDQTLGNIALAAVKEHPTLYLKNTLNIFWQLHSKGIPYWDNLWLFGEKFSGQQLFCGSYGTIKFCEPIIKTPWSFSTWNLFVLMSNKFYEYLFPVFTIALFFPSALILLFNRKYRIFPILYLLGTIPIALYVHPDPRYILPFYPLMIICVFLAPLALRHRNTAPPPALNTKATTDIPKSSRKILET